jgi:hypothetical protein
VIAPTPLAEPVWPYARRVSVERSIGGMYAFVVSLPGWQPGSDLRRLSRHILNSLDASCAAAKITAITETVLWIDVEPD